MTLVELLTHAGAAGGGIAALRGWIALRTSREDRHRAAHEEKAAEHNADTARHRAVTVGFEVSQETFRAALARLASLERTMDAVNDARMAERESCASQIAALKTELKHTREAHATELAQAHKLIEGLHAELRALRAQVLSQVSPQRPSDRPEEP